MKVTSKPLVDCETRNILIQSHLFVYNQYWPFHGSCYFTQHHTFVKTPVWQISFKVVFDLSRDLTLLVLSNSKKFQKTTLHVPNNLAFNEFKYFYFSHTFSITTLLLFACYKSSAGVCRSFFLKFNK